MKERIDVLLVKRKMVDSRTKAQWLIKSGYVLVDKKQIMKPSKRIENTLEIEVTRNFPYVGRGGLKLESALKNFSISVKGKICVDIGASVGGFTDCLIKHGALRVYAIDTATNLLHPSLLREKMKEKVIPLLGIDARNLSPIEEKVDICTIDVTFSSLKAILPSVRRILKKDGDIIGLVKPVFETEFYTIRRLDIGQDPNKLFQILNDLIQWITDNQFYLYGIIKSHTLDKERSKEFLLHLRLKQNGLKLDFKKLIMNFIE
ncbi:MAG: TlyA family RNA methyltransferase [Candidatus Hodarchaeota archaeon]